MSVTCNLYDLIILGGGASGLMAAIAAFRQNRHASVLLLERNEQLGRKLLATGNGRCNFSHADQDLHHYRSHRPDVVQEILNQFGLSETLLLFHELGLHTRCEEGRYYPRSNQGRVVPLLLQEALLKTPIHIQRNTPVQTISRTDKGFHVFTTDGRCYSTEKLLLATGGKASPQLGSDGDFYVWLREVGHHVYPVYPALTPLKLNLLGLKKISGVRFWGRAECWVEEDMVQESEGEFLWTPYGISGIPTLQMSRFAAEALGDQKRVVLKMDFLPEWDERGAQNIIFSWMMKNRGEVVIALSGILHSNLAEYLVSLVETQIGPIKAFHPGQAARLAKLLKGWILPVPATLDWKDAQSTVGGVDLSEIDSKTLASKKVPGLFLAGEILDVDGNCGGYNLQWAWSSGFLAGQGAMK